MYDFSNPLNLRGSLLLICTLLAVPGCDILWRSHLVSDPENCVQEPTACGNGMVCNQRTEVCEPGVTLTAVSPPVGPSTGGTLMTLTGTAFVDGMTVTFDGQQATNVVVLSATMAQVALPARPGVRGKVIVSVTTPPDQLAVRTDLFSYYPGDLNFSPAAEGSTVAGPQTLASADFNGDQQPDLVIAGYSSASLGVQLGKGDGTFVVGTAVPVGSAPIGVNVGDIDGDGFVDLISSDFGSGGISVALGNGNGTFQPYKFAASGSGPTWTAVKDADGDGHVDLAVANTNAASVIVLYGKGDGTFDTPPALNVGARTTWVAFGEFGSGTGADLAIAYDNIAALDIYRRDSPRSYVQAGRYVVGSVPRAVAVGDFNHDGLSDVAVANYGSSTVGVLMGASGGLQSAVDFNIGTGPYSVSLGDVNGDGELDVLTGNPQGNDVGILLGKGDGSFAAVVRQASGANTRHAICADFDSDGRNDIAAVNFNASSVSILLNISQ